MFCLSVYFLFFLILFLASNPNKCPPPTLADGYVVPEKGSYVQNEQLSYACETSFEPAVGVWWAISTCTNGKWTPVPKCNAGRCGPILHILNGEAKINRNSITYTCKAGYRPTGSDTVLCFGTGKWSTPPPFLMAELHLLKYSELQLNNVETHQKYQMQEQNSSLGAYATVAMMATKSRIPLISCTVTRMGLGPLVHNAKLHLLKYSELQLNNVEPYHEYQMQDQKSSL
ncbi:Coagulation factor XIII B chain [Merluccius polli]|uniref:Coagulation factor XIII B chain n=1 Tax=Merluccius polli TaxID=89951 RepID=A0AA47NAJ6_MERPO|nr:Coagulation factor XIII B chain [Merluccius polli]